MDASLDRVVLSRQTERVVAHRVQHALAATAAEVRDRVADGVVLQVTYVRLSAGIRQHLEHVGVLLAPARLHEPARPLEASTRRRHTVGGALVGDLPGALIRPHRLPARLDLLRVIAAFCHRRRTLAGLRRGEKAAAIAQQLDDRRGRLVR